ncbi:MAG TPA: OmpA family protein [Geminicoccaceae bacterium]
MMRIRLLGAGFVLLLLLLHLPGSLVLAADDLDADALAARLKAFVPRAPGVVVEEEWTRPDVSCTPIQARGVFHADSAKVVRRPRVELEINFPFGSAELTASAVDQLRVLADALEKPAIGADRFVLVGHTDGVGSDSANRALSEARARAVERHLVEAHGIDRSRLRSRGCGESALKDRDDPNSPVNRRVEVVNAGP